ncbi:hypothetical protein B5E53_07870 [Eubacterium sp. An11]|uniref:NAD-dependent epimerase/dehydratase family protein n=1 Tax=Eubacterium sp. An11 TaxID=1965542 RepID=UPI000B366513|nr:NAD(P)-dependent oxidoreductase [Eubacterium sp. An11]OUQ67903.1 hypothetical protein B5E53_07870 [Eubacterium sp. An11]
MKVAVTGATGLVGRKAVDCLKNGGFEVVPLTRNVKEGYVSTDYGVESLTAIFKDVDAVVHLAARREGNCRTYEDFQSNENLTENILLAMKNSDKCNRIIYMSSISVYSGEKDLPWDEEVLPKPKGFYGLSKLVCEHLCGIYQRFGINYTILRCAHILGIEEKGYMLSKFMSGAYNHKQICVIGKSVAKREFIYVKDVANAIAWALTSNESINQTFNLGYGKGYTNLQIAVLINQAFGNEGNLQYKSDVSEGIQSSYTNVSKIYSAGFKPQFSIETSMKDLYQEYCGIQQR